MRIVSLLPSATEICFAVGLENSLVGVTHECDYPPLALKKPRVTSSKPMELLTSREIDNLVRSQLDDSGTLYELDFDQLKALAPDVILTQRLCTVCAVSIDRVRELASRLPKVPRVENLEPRTLDDVLETIQRVGMLGGGTHSVTLLRSLRKRIEHVRKAAEGQRSPKALVLEWVDPPFASGHWIPELVEIAGGVNALAFKHAPSREVTWDRIVASQPDIIVIAACGFGIERQRQDLKVFWQKLRETEHGFAVMPEVWVCDGSQYFSRPGPRLVDTLEILAGILHIGLRQQFLGKYQSGKDFESIT